MPRLVERRGGEGGRVRVMKHRNTRKDCKQKWRESMIDLVEMCWHEPRRVRIRGVDGRVHSCIHFGTETDTETDRDRQTDREVKETETETETDRQSVNNPIGDILITE